MYSAHITAEVIGRNMTIKELYEKYGDVELTEEQEKQIKEYLGIKNKKWRLAKNEEYFVIDLVSMENNIQLKFNNNVDLTLKHISLGNCFKTKEEADFRLEQIKVYNELKNFADENNEEIDWKCDAPKYYFYLNSINNNLVLSDLCRMRDIGQIYFSSKELAQQAIDKVGADRIKKYLFGVEI